VIRSSNSQISPLLMFGLAATVMYCNWDGVLCPMLHHMKWDHQRDWFAVCQGEFFFEYLISTGTIHHSDGYLLSFSNQGPGYVDFFWNVRLQAQFYQAIFCSVGALKSGYHDSLIVPVSHGHWLSQGGNTCELPGGSITILPDTVPGWTHRYVPWLLPRCSVGLRPRVSTIKACFRMGINSPDTVFSL
jgi:hypothetical protein